jgi:hypothetical protein
MNLQVIEKQELTPATLYPEVHEQLAKLAEENDKAVFDYEDPKQNKLARSHIYSLRGYKSAVEKRRKELKADALEYGRKVDGAAKEITAQIEDMIAVHEEPIKRIEQREKDRLAAIQEAIDLLGESSETPTALDAPSSEIADAIKRVEAISIDPDVYQERMAEATTRKRELLEHLSKCHKAAVSREDEAAELARLRAEAEERERKDREEVIAREAAERAQREAEAKAQREREEAERKAQAERAEAARREREAIERAERAEREKAEAAKKAEEERIAALKRAEQARQDAIDEAERKQQEAEAEAARKAEAQRVADEKRAADKKHRAKIRSEIIDDLAKFGGSDDPCASLADALIAGEVRHVTIQF